MKATIIALVILFISCENSSENKPGEQLTLGKWNAEFKYSKNKNEQLKTSGYIIPSKDFPYNTGFKILENNKLSYMFDEFVYTETLNYNYSNGTLTLESKTYKITNITSSSFDLELENGVKYHFKKR